MWVLFVGASQAACPNVATALKDAEGAITEAREADAREALDRAEQGIHCEGTTTDLLHRLLLAEGTLRWIQGEGADPAFQAASRIDSASFNKDFGPEVRRAYEEAADAPAQTGTIRLTGKVPGQPTLNAMPTTFPVEAPAGLHLIQVTDDDAPPPYSNLVMLAPGEELVLDTGEVPERLSLGADKRRKKPWWLVMGGIGAAGAGTFVTLARLEDDQFEGANTKSDLDATLTDQQQWAGFAYGSAGLMVTGLTLHFVL